MGEPTRLGRFHHSQTNPTPAHWYQSGIIVFMAMTLRLTDEEQMSLRLRSEAEGISMQEAARRAVREFVAQADHRERVALAAERVTRTHAEALRRLGE